MKVNKRQLAEILGVDDDTVTEWQKHPDFPAYRRGTGRKGSEYDTVSVIRWKFGDGESQRDRISRLQAEKLEIELDVLRGRAAYLDEIEEALGPQCDSVRAKLLGMSAYLCPKIVGVGLSDAIRITDDYADQLLTEFSGTEGFAALKDRGVGSEALRGPVSEAAEADAIAVGGRASKAKSRGKRGAGPVAH